MLSSFCNTTVTVLRAPTVTARGHESRDWTRAEAHEVEGCSVQRDASRRAMTDRATHAETTRPLYAPPGSDIKNGDRIIVGSVTYEVMGDPTEWESPTGALDHLQCDIAVWSG